jgi:hypothetical protein
MIPEFPQFKGLELSDKEDVEKITKKFPPYSDFNFVSMWSWDIKGEMRISLLNGNLVVRFTDYLTGEPFYSFLGNNKVNETAEKLLELSKKEGAKLKLRLVPEDSIKGMDGSHFKILEDRDHFDYILSLDVIKDFSSRKTNSKKRAVKGLVRDYSPVVEILDLSNIEHQNKIFQFIKESLPDDKVIENEFLAIKRFVRDYKNKNFIILGAFVKSKLVGFCFTEVLAGGFSNFHFWKADTKNYKPMYSFLLREKARLLHGKYNGKYLNIEQDLGIENLRNWKESFGSQFFLRKYNISLQN